jgi:hypothetical protein
LYLTNKGLNQVLEGLFVNCTRKRSCKNDILLEEPASKGQSKLPLKNLHPPFYRYMYC